MDDQPEAKPRDFDDPNDRWNIQFFRATDRLVESGMDEGEASREAINVMQEALTKIAPTYVEEVLAGGRQHLAETSEFRAGFVERLRAHWGEALDLYELICVLVEDGGMKFAKRNLHDENTYSLLLDVLVQLNGQAIRVAREIHGLLSAGFPLGAHSLARTIHEISVRAGILREFGMREEQADLAERFVLHDQVINYRDALIYQRDYERLGYAPIDDTEVAGMKQQHDSLLERFGASYGTPYGWAAGLPGLTNPKRPSFEDLETLAELDHFRGMYRWSSHFVHGDSKALRLGRVERGGSKGVLTGATNAMLADPGQHSVIGLMRVFTSMVTAGQPFAFHDMLLTESVLLLVDKTCNALVDAEDAVRESEERLQEEFRAQGQTFTPTGPVDLVDPLDADTDGSSVVP